jgi:hypothetical protein
VISGRSVLFRPSKRHGAGLSVQLRKLREAR